MPTNSQKEIVFDSNWFAVHGTDKLAYGWERVWCVDRLADNGLFTRFMQNSADVQREELIKKYPEQAHMFEVTKVNCMLMPTGTTIIRGWIGQKDAT